MPRKTVVSRHEGGMRFVARSGSKHDLVMDNALGDTGMRPTEVILAGLTACAGMDVVSIMIKKRQAFDSYSVRAKGEQREGHPDVYARIDLVHEIVGPDVDVAQVRRCIELSATRYCPVSAMLSAGEAEIHHRYLVRVTGATPFEEEGEVLVTGPSWKPHAIPR